MTDYSTEAAEVAAAIDAVYENKQTNKKNDITGDYSSDNVSYPTCKAVKAWADNTFVSSADLSGYEQTSNKKSSWSSTVTDTNYPTEKLVKDSLDGKLDKAQTSYKGKNVVVDSTTGNITFENKPTIPTKTSDLTNDGDGNNAFLTQHQSLASKTVTIAEQATAETGYAKTYVISQGGTALSPKINIPKDFLVKSGSVKTCTTANVPVQGYQVGDKYIDFVINAKDSSATDEHMYILVKDLVEDTTYAADESTLHLNTTGNVFSIKNGGVGSDQIATAVKNTWLSTSDVASEISSFASALADAINPSTP